MHSPSPGVSLRISCLPYKFLFFTPLIFSVLPCFFPVNPQRLKALRPGRVLFVMVSVIAFVVPWLLLIRVLWLFISPSSDITVAVSAGSVVKGGTMDLIDYMILLFSYRRRDHERFGRERTRRDDVQHTRTSQTTLYCTRMYISCIAFPPLYPPPPFAKSFPTKNKDRPSTSWPT